MTMWRLWWQRRPAVGPILGSPQDKGFLRLWSDGCLLLGDDGMGGLTLG